MKKSILKIEGMHCASCAVNIDLDLEEILGIHKTQTNYAKCLCNLEFDEKMTDINKIIKAVKKSGYEARET